MNFSAKHKSDRRRKTIVHWVNLVNKILYDASSSFQSFWIQKYASRPIHQIIYLQFKVTWSDLFGTILFLQSESCFFFLLLLFFSFWEVCIFLSLLGRTRSSKWTCGLTNVGEGNKLAKEVTDPEKVSNSHAEPKNCRHYIYCPSAWSWKNSGGRLGGPPQSGVCVERTKDWLLHGTANPEILRRVFKHGIVSFSANRSTTCCTDVFTSGVKGSQALTAPQTSRKKGTAKATGLSHPKIILFASNILILSQMYGRNQWYFYNLIFLGQKWPLQKKPTECKEGAINTGKRARGTQLEAVPLTPVCVLCLVAVEKPKLACSKSPPVIEHRATSPRVIKLHVMENNLCPFWRCFCFVLFCFFISGPFAQKSF